MPTGSMVFLVFTGVVTFAVILQTIVLVAIIVTAKASQRKIMEQVEKLQDQLNPVLNAATDLMELFHDLSPRVQAITTNVQTASERLRQQGAQGLVIAAQGQRQVVRIKA